MARVGPGPLLLLDEVDQAVADRLDGEDVLTVNVAIVGRSG
jgi:hypothetical protein